MSILGRISHFAEIIVLAALFPTLGPAQLTDAAKAAIRVNSRYTISPDLVYRRATNYDLKLDVFQPLSRTPTPTVLYIHGGGWATGSKAEEMLWLLPYLEAGWAAINVEYRLLSIAPAPAAIEDCRCALRWVRRNARQYNFDLSKLIVTGASAGGHLALMTGLVPDSAGFDNQCLADDDQPWTGVIRDSPRIAAIVNWFGPTDMVDLLRERRSYAFAWLGGAVDMNQLAKAVSPVTYVRTGVPPVLTVHGDSDPLVPYAHALKLHNELKNAGVENQLVTIPGGKHGDFSEAEWFRAYEAIHAFLSRLHLSPESK